MRTLLCFLLFGVLALVAAPDTNITGKWSGTYTMTGPDGQANQGTAVLLLKQTGNEITGTAGEDEGDQHAITKGRIEADRVTILVEDEGRTFKFDLVLAADRITGDVNISHDGQTMKAKLDVTRAK